MPAASIHESRVLVVDDCEPLRYLKTHHLLEAGYRVSQADTGIAAIRSIEAERPDLVLLDVNLPDMHGSEVCLEVKMRWALPVIYTSSVDIPAELHGMADGCLVSLDAEALLDMVRRALDERSRPVPLANAKAAGGCIGTAWRARTSPTELVAQRGIFEAGALRQVLDASRAFMVVLNRNREVVFCNRAVLSLAGVASLPAVLGSRLGEMFHCENATQSPKSCGTTGMCRSCVMPVALDGPREATWEWSVVRSVNGLKETCDLRVTTSPIEGQEGFVLCTLAEFSHEKGRQAIERLFFHDILNIAGGVHGLAALLSDELKGGSNAELAREVERNADDLVTEIRTRQQISLAESGQLPIAPAAVGTLELVRTAAARYRNYYRFRGRTILVDPHTEDLRMETDPAILSSVLGDMLTNALAATQPGGTVTIGCEATQVGIEFYVHDPGVIPSAAQLHILQNSFSTKDGGRVLGTYSMKLLTERYLGGTVQFESSALNGTRFFARYPTAVASASNVAYAGPA